MPKDLTALNCSKSSVIEGLFVAPADENYLVARWCYQNKVYRSFYWNAAQALEKYMKAILLFNGYSAIHPLNQPKKPYVHNLVALLASVYQIAFEFLPIDLELPTELGSKVWGWIDEPLRKYVARINTAGNPNNRYNLYGLNKMSGDLYKLDSLIYSLRRLTYNLSDPFYFNVPKDNDEHEFTLADALRKLPTYNPRNQFEFAYKPFRDCSDEVKFFFLNHNFPFSKSLQPDFQHKPLDQRWYSENSALYMTVFSYLEWNSGMETYEDVLALIPWIKDNIKLSTDDQRDLAEAFLLIEAKKNKQINTKT